MKESAPQKPTNLLLEAKLKEVRSLLDAFISQKRKEKIEDGKIVTIFSGPFAYRDMRVILVGKSGMIHMKPITEPLSETSFEVIKFPENEVFTVADFHKAIQELIEKQTKNN